MTLFRTRFEIPKSSTSIDYDSKIMLIGSCFSDNIGNKLTGLKFNVLSNPHGVLYNPYSIQEAIRLAIGDREIDDEDFVFHDGLWHSYLHHSSFSEKEKQTLMEKINLAREKTLDSLQNAKILFITFGTAWIFELRKSGRIVSNCHKVPAKEFKRFRLSTCDITDEITILLNRLEQINPDLKVVFTLSPIRHLKDGVVENQLSKAILKVAIHELVEMHSQCSYFPSYELVMDDLRDYRFYADDMTHLAQTAIQYIFERFTETYIPGKAQSIMKQVEKLNRAVHHKPFNIHTEAHQKFLTTTINQIEQLVNKSPAQDWSNELQKLKSQVKEG